MKITTKIWLTDNNDDDLTFKIFADESDISIVHLHTAVRVIRSPAKMPVFLARHKFISTVGKIFYA